jgi:predicted CXXCH cytochrome family protein
MKREGDSCTRCHTDYTNRSGHDKAKAQPCTVCHDPHQSAYDKMLRTPAPDLCANCHEDVTGKTGGTHSLHAPVAKEGCFRCHVSHVQNTPKLLRATDPELCVECHPNVRLPSHEKAFPRCGLCHKPHLSDEPRLLASDKFPACSQCHKDPGTGPNVHKALKDSTCLACHSPHRKMAASSVQEVCGKCHNVSSETFSRPHGGLPFEKVDQCLLCHLPHAGEGRRGLLSGDAHYPIKSGGCGVCHVGENGKTVLRYAGSENCVRCHGDTVGTSSVMDKEKVHRPITQQDCVACHDPHLRRRKAMLIEEPMVLCDFCHGAVVRMGSVKHGVFKNGDCLTCHSPHFSEDRPLLKKPQPDLCFDCHPDAAPRDVSRDPLAHGALKGNRCGSCHSPHTSEDKKLIRESRDKACASCHVEILKDKKGNPWANLHGPVGTGTCTACHYMGHRHRKANDAFLLTSPPAKVCEDCHEVTNEHIPANDRLRMTRIQGGCLGCHSPHGAGNGLMLKDY